MLGLDAVVSEIRDRVQPSSEQQNELESVIDEVVERTESAVEELPIEADILLVGSTARETWLPRDRDIDVFIRFPATVSMEDLESYGLRVGHAVLPDSVEEYAEHPYVRGQLDGFRVDIVPCYAVESSREIQSSVDRTPFHTAYVTDRLTDEVATEVRVFKQFLTGIGVYGSDLKTEGVSGYLAELLVIEYGSFTEVITAVADWEPPVVLDPENHGEKEFDDPLVVIDPTDPTRNVAAVVSPTNIARLQHYARELLTTPNSDIFYPDPPEPVSRSQVTEHLESRGTTPIAIVFEAPNLVEDELYPQLHKSLTGISTALTRRGFDVFRDAVFAAEHAVLFIELAVPERPAVERHRGPPVHVKSHAQEFYATYVDEPVYGPFISGDRYVVERDREFRSAEALLRSDAIFEMRLGPDIQAALNAAYDVLVGREVAELADEFGAAFADYFDPSP